MRPCSRRAFGGPACGAAFLLWFASPQAWGVSGYSRFFRYRQFLLNARVRRRAIGVIEWLCKILPRSFLNLPKRAPFPKNEKLLFFGNGTAQPLSCVHDLYSFVLVFGLIGARNQHLGEKNPFFGVLRQSPPARCCYEAATKSMSSCLLCTSSFR